MSGLVCERKKLMQRKELYVAILICAIIAVAAFVEEAVSMLQMDYGSRYSSIQTAMISGNSAIGQMVIICLIPILASIPFADTYNLEKKAGMICLHITRETAKSYLYSKFAVNAIVGFLIAILPFALNQILCLIAFPGITNAVDNTGIYNMPFDWNMAQDYVLFPDIAMNFPLTNNILHILMMGFWGMALSTLSFTIGLFGRINRLIVLVFTTVLWLLMVLLFAKSDTIYLLPAYYLFAAPMVKGLTFQMFCIYIVILIFFNVVVTAVYALLKKDIL